MIDSMLTTFQVLYHTMPEIKLRVPGRINLIGEHTDYNQGFVLPAAIDRYTYFLCSPNNTNAITLYSLDFSEKHVVDLGIDAISLSGWQKYAEAAILIMKQQGYKLSGLNMLISSNIPLGAGLSSSASFTCGIILSISELYNHSISRDKIALMAQQAEELIGINCGLMDQYAVLQSRSGHCLFMDCRDLSFQFLPAEFKDCSIVLIDSKVKHDLADSAYNERREDTENALKMVQQFYPAVSSLREITFDILAAIEMNPRYKRRLTYLLEENQRVLDTCKALKTSNMTTVGNLMNASHKGLSELYEVSCEELDFLAQFAQQQDFIYGSRMMGGGFGGCTINLVKTGYEQRFIEKIIEAYHTQMGKKADSLTLNISEGAHEL